MRPDLISKRVVRALLIPLMLLGAGAESFATSITLEGQNKGDTNNWFGGNLQGWQELDMIPCRVHWVSAPGSNQPVTLIFEHQNNGVPGIQNLFYFTSSSNVVFSSLPTLIAPPGAKMWSYTFTVDILDAQPAYVFFCARLAAGAP